MEPVGLPQLLRDRLVKRLGGLAVVSLFFAISGFFMASWLSARFQNVGAGAYGLWLGLAVNAYFQVWRLGQLLWNLRFREPVQCSVQLVSQKDSGLDRRTTVFLPELNQKAMFGRTSFAWTPTPFLVRPTVYVFPGRYAVVVADGSPPVASTLRM